MGIVFSVLRMNILNEVLALWTINELSIDDGLLLSFGGWKMAENRGYEYISYYDNPHVYIQCSDRFYWATADYELIETAEDIELLRVTIEDCKVSLDDGINDKWADTEDVCVVYCARKRNLQPMPRYMKGKIEELCKVLPENKVWH